MKKIILVIPILFVIFGCGKKSKIDLPGLTDLNVTAIALNQEGEVIDFVHIKPDSEIDRIEFHAPENGHEIRVTAVGPSVHPYMPSEMVVTSKLAQGFMGKVTVEVDDGIITSISGNGMMFENPLNLEDLKEIKGQLGPDRAHLETTRIVKKNKYLSELVEDSEGNLVPKEITEERKLLLTELMLALENSDLKKLATFVHKDKGDSSDINTVLDFLKYVSNEDIKRYRFMRFDSEHPDSQNKLQDMDGQLYRYSLPVEWVLTTYFTDSDAYIERSADLLIGSENGRLKFPTKYAD